MEPKEIEENLKSNYKIINKKYVCYLNFIIGSGTFGSVLYGSDCKAKREFAIKFEKSNIKTSVIELEYSLYKALGTEEGIPNIEWIGEYKSYKLIVLELLGPSLEKFFIGCNKKFSKVTVSLLGDQMIRRLKYIHSKGIVHRDIKPNNFMLGRFSKSMDYINEKTLYIIDFGLSKEYIDFETNTHLPFRDGRRFIGTPRYASIGSHLGYKQSRRDDIESVSYILIYFLIGELPWQGIKAKSKAEKKEKIKEVKLEYDFSLNKEIPKQLITLLNYSKSLEYEERPDYNLILNLINEVLTEATSDFIVPFDIKKHIWEWNSSFLNVKNSSSTQEYQRQKNIYQRLYNGYPILKFDDFLEKLQGIVCNSDYIIPTTSSTTSNTATYMNKSKKYGDEENETELEKRILDLKIKK